MVKSSMKVHLFFYGCLGPLLVLLRDIKTKKLKLKQECPLLVTATRGQLVGGI